MKGLLSFFLSILLIIPATGFTETEIDEDADDDLSPTPHSSYYCPKVTHIYSINNEIEKARYKPRANEIYDFESKVQEDGEFAYAYTGYFDLNNSGPYKGTNPSRQLEVLGYDALLLSDSYNRDKRKYDAKLATVVTKSYAIMNIYKALGKEKQKIDLYYEPFDRTVNNSPFSTLLTVPIEDVDFSKGKTYAFITRTVPDEYWEQAVQDHVVQDYSTKEEHMTVGEFCLLVKNLMHLYGEEVLTEEEQLYLLQTYGKNLPYSIPANQLEAVKYLMAKGIVVEQYTYSSEIDIDTMLSILMRVKDENSRETFKNINITYDRSLLSKGYYPTSISTENNVVQITDWGVDYSTASLFDYFIKIIDGKTAFTKEDGTEITTLYVSDSYNHVSLTKVEGSQFLGIENGYYHFKIPSDITVTHPSAVHNKCVTITAGDTKSSPTVINLELGGGYYTDTNSKGIYTRKKFGVDDDLKLVDQDRKKKKQDEAKSDTFLFDITQGTYTVTFKLNGANENDVTYDGKKLSECDSSVLSKTPDGTYIISGLTDINSVREKLKVTHDSAKSYQAYGKLGDDYVVNITYLKDIGLVSSATELNPNLMLLTTPNANIYLDSEHNRIISGSTVYEVPSGTLLIYKQGTDTFVNYKAVLGWSSDFISFTDTDGTVSISYSNAISITDVTKTKAVKLPFGSSNTTNANIDSNNKLSLASSYALSNYMVYSALDSNVGAAVDYLFVFKLKAGLPQNITYDDSSARQVLKNRLGYDAPDSWLVYYYILNKEDTVCGVSYEGNSYVFNIPEVPDNIDEFAQKYYIGGTDNPYTIPIVRDSSGNFFDYNFNLITDSAGNACKFGYMRISYIPNTTGEDSTLVTPLGVTTEKSNSSTIKAAPTGVALSLISRPEHTFSQIRKVSTNSIYYGTMYVEVDTSNSSDPKFSTGGSYLNIGDTANLKFKPLYLFATEGRYSIICDDLIKTDDADSNQSALAKLLAGVDFVGFDWDSFKFKTLLENADSAINLLLIFVLNIVPRIGLFLFLLILTLCPIANVPIVQKFCDKVFDPYKFLTLGKQNVHTIDIFKMFYMSIIAVGIFALFLDGTIIVFLSWISGTAISLLSRLGRF